MRRRSLKPPISRIVRVHPSPTLATAWTLDLTCGHWMHIARLIEPGRGNTITCPECVRILKSNLDGHKP